MRLATEPRKTGASCRILDSSPPTRTVASEILSRFRITYRRRLKLNWSISRWSDLRRRSRPTLIDIVSDRTDPVGPDPITSHVFGRPRPTTQILNRKTLLNTAVQPRPAESKYSRQSSCSRGSVRNRHFQLIDSDRNSTPGHIHNYF